MKTSYGTILVLAMAAVVLLTTPLPCRAAEKEKEDIWSDDRPKRAPVRWELTDEKIGHILSLLKESNPKKVEELEKLRQEDPEKFKAEIRKVMREQFGRRFKQQRAQRFGREPRTGRDVRQFGPRHAGPAEPAGKWEMAREHMQQWSTEFLQWLEKNYPEQAKKLAQLKEKKPELYFRQFRNTMRRYRRIFEASKENPKLAEVLKEDLELKENRDKLLRKIAAASDDEKKKLTGQLEKVVGSRFDLIVKRKQMAYQQMRKELEKLKEQVRQSEAEVEKRKDAKFKNENVKSRVKELVGRTEKFRWD